MLPQLLNVTGSFFTPASSLVCLQECHPIEVALFTTQCRHRCPAKPSTEVKNNGNSVARKLLHLLGEAAPATQAPDHNPGLADGDHGHSLVSASHRQVLGQLRKLQGTKDGDDDFPWWFLEDQESGKRRKLQGTKDGDDDFPWWFLEDQESGKRRKLMAGGNCERVCLKVPYKSVETRCELKFRKVASCRAISPSECMRVSGGSPHTNPCHCFQLSTLC
jgi:hypothetical protein